MNRSIRLAIASGAFLLTAVAGPLSAEEVAPPEKAADLPAGFISEAPLPEGFPPPSEPGKVVEKSYPVLRSYSAAGPNAFFRCFMYLQKNEHEMTAPVVMDYEGGQAAAEGERSEMPVPVNRMHFLLETLDLDQPKLEGDIQVADMQPLRVLSIAYQGQLTRDQIDGLESKLTAALAERPDLKAAGKSRILGYNSPMIPRNKSFWEIQLPVAAARDDSD